MPKLRMDGQAARERALRRAIARAQVDLDLPEDQDVARTLRIGSSTYSKRKKKLYEGFGFDKVSVMARELHFSAKELCEIVGVPFQMDAGA